MKNEALLYIKNHGGRVTENQFNEDFLPVGPILIDELITNGYAEQKKDTIILK